MKGDMLYTILVNNDMQIIIIECKTTLGSSNVA
jgi:hypothetical protein